MHIEPRDSPVKIEPCIPALRRILAPLVHLMLKRGVGFPTVAAVLKSLFVDIAERRHAAPGRRMTARRLSVLTGLQRRDIKAIQAEAKGPERPLEGMGPLPRVLARWAGGPEYQTADGDPLILPRQDVKGGPSFERLCLNVSRDIHPRTVLDALCLQGAVEYNSERDIVSLSSATFLSRDDAALAEYLGANVGDHAMAAVENMLSASAPFFERAVHYNKLKLESVAELDALARQLHGESLLKLNAAALRLQTQDGGAPEATARFRTGAYVLHENQIFPEEQ